MTGQEIEISRFKNTAFYDIAVKSNINGGTTLKGVEIQLFESATEGLGLSLEDYGLKVVQGEELTSKQARKNVKTEGKDVEKLYKTQFGSEGKQAVESSEQRAHGIIETAKMSFERNHKGINFTPEEIGNRPVFTEAKYSGKPTKYAADLVAWAKDVAASYDLHDKMSNEDLAALIINNDNLNARNIIINDNINTERLSNEMNAWGNALMQAVENGKAEIIRTVRNAEGHIVKTIRDAEANIVNVVQDAEGHIVNVVREEGVKTRNTTRRVGRELQYSNDRQHAATRNQVRESAHETQEINQAVSEISARLNAKGASPKSAATIKRLEQAIVDSYMPHEEKMKLLNELKGLAYTEQGLDRFEIIVNKHIQESPYPAMEWALSPYEKRPFNEEMNRREEFDPEPTPNRNYPASGAGPITNDSKPNKKAEPNKTNDKGYPESLPTKELREMYRKAPDYAREKLKNAIEDAHSKGQELTEEKMKDILKG